MVALGQPIFENLYLGRIGLRCNTHGERRNAVADEVVLIAAYEKIPQRLRIGLNAYSLRPGDLARATAKIGVVKAKHSEEFKRHYGQKHVDIHIGDY